MNLQQARRIYAQTGHHFFDADTMRFFGSKIETDLFENRCFVTSEDNFNQTERWYNVRQFGKDYKSVNTVGEFNSHATLEDAVKAALAVTGEE